MTIRLSDLLRERRGDILDRFVSADRDRGFSPGGASRQLIVDHIHSFLDGCADWLDGDSRGDSKSVETVSSRMHGGQRWATGYELRDLVLEYGVLLQCVLQMIEHEKIDIGLAEFHRLAVVINLGIAEAVVEFAIGNAIQVTPTGGAVVPSAVPVGVETRFEVRDGGPGIPESHLPFLFDSFWQAPDEPTNGTGIGLAISKALVEAHEGRIGAEVLAAGGSAFHFTLRPAWKFWLPAAAASAST